MIQKLTRSVLFASLMLACAMSRGASFTPLGDLPGGPFESQAFGVSYDGSVVVGGSLVEPGRHQAFRWTKSGGMIPLSGGPFTDTTAIDVSENGLVIVGAGNDNLGFRWTMAEGIVGLGGVTMAANGLTPDGSVIVGGSNAYRWTSGTGSVVLPFDSAQGISADGSVIVGFVSPRTVFRAVRWTQATGVVSLGALPATDQQSLATAVSADGSVIVGTSSSGTAGSVPFRWTEASGMVSLGSLPGGTPYSSAYDLSADGSIIVGVANNSSAASSFVWTAASGMLNLRDVLAAGGATGFENWTSLQVYGISGDGSTVVGYGRNANGQDEAFVASIAIPEPAAISLAMLGVGAIAARRRRR